MLGKFISRWGSYRVAAYCTGKRDWRVVREVINPRKDSKVEEVAARHGIERRVFPKACKRLLWVLLVWP
jgi:hypothetical protein